MKFTESVYVVRFKQTVTIFLFVHMVLWGICKHELT